ncbi:MAG: hypothetical protein H6753_07135 [Candidatus Omnitrophica bacterium]|nr:hypothetical protein [Candidatus Omnitrophota bacterium]
MKPKWLLIAAGILISSFVYADELKSIPADTKIIFQEYSLYPSKWWKYSTIYASGKVEFGELADYVDHVSIDEVAELVGMFTETGFFSIEDKDLICSEEYYILHVPTVEIALTMNGKTKEIHYTKHQSCKDKAYLEIERLADKIDAIIAATDWVKEQRRKFLPVFDDHKGQN